MKRENIREIDCHFAGRPLRVCAYLLWDSSEVAFIDNNTPRALPFLLRALEEEELSPEQVKYIIVTHIHLDHSAGTAALARACPNATVLAHPRAAPHLIDPTRIVSSSKRIYGEELFSQLYGEIDPLPEKQLQAVEDEEILHIGNRPLHFIHTRGHANHHFCIHDSSSQSIFTGDSFGVAYPDMQGDRSPVAQIGQDGGSGNNANNTNNANDASDSLLIYPSTAPTQFHAEESRKSIGKILATSARCAYLTHYGPVARLEKAAELLLKDLDTMEEIVNEAAELLREEIAPFCRAKVQQFFYRKAEEVGLDPQAKARLLEHDLSINSSGLAYAAQRLQHR